MAPIGISHVLRCSSQDSKHCAENLINSKSNSVSKWLCDKETARNRISQIEVEFQLKQMAKISYIDIGNAGTALIEILVGNSFSESINKFKALLPTVSLMNALEAKEGRKDTQVHMFSKEQFMSETRESKYDCIKLVCRQPFTRDKAYGISFIKVGSFDAVNENIKSSSKTDIVFDSDSVANKPSKTEETPNKDKDKQPMLNRIRLFNPNKSPLQDAVSMSTSSDKSFREEATQFFNEVDGDKLKSSSLHDLLTELRPQLENQRGKPFTCREVQLFGKIIFMAKNGGQKKRPSSVEDKTEDSESLTSTSIVKRRGDTRERPPNKKPVAKVSRTQDSKEDQPPQVAKNGCLVDCLYCNEKFATSEIAMHVASIHCNNQTRKRAAPKTTKKQAKKKPVKTVGLPTTTATTNPVKVNTTTHSVKETETLGPHSNTENKKLEKPRAGKADSVDKSPCSQSITDVICIDDTLSIKTNRTANVSTIDLTPKRSRKTHSDEDYGQLIQKLKGTTNSQWLTSKKYCKESYNDMITGKNIKREDIGKLLSPIPKSDKLIVID